MASRAASASLVIGFAIWTACGRAPERPVDPPPPAPPRVLRVCADPNNLPFSNDKGEGFENELARLLARDLNVDLQYTWWAQRRGFVRNTLNARLCDVVMGMPTGSELVSTTDPYYTSTYVFVTRRDRHLDLRTLDDPRLRRLTIGVHLAGDDYANPPPAHALARRGIVDNVRGYRLLDDYSQPSPTARIVEAVTRGEVDTAIVWGPIGGYFAAREPAPLAVAAVPADEAMPGMPFAFSIAVGVRKDDAAFRDEINTFLVRRARDIDALLTRYDVPRVRQTRVR